MPAELEPLYRIECTYADCYESFDTERQMKSHKKHSDEHEYCHKCDEDFEDFEAFAFHKILAPLKHDKACRLCGDEFKSVSGHRRHVEMVRQEQHLNTLLLTMTESQDQPATDLHWLL